MKQWRNATWNEGKTNQILATSHHQGRESRASYLQSNVTGMSVCLPAAKPIICVRAQKKLYNFIIRKVSSLVQALLIFSTVVGFRRMSQSVHKIYFNPFTLQTFL
jgi:hypothetical protein